MVEWPPDEVSLPPPAELFEDAKPVDRLVNVSLNERYCIYLCFRLVAIEDEDRLTERPCPALEIDRFTFNSDSEAYQRGVNDCRAGGTMCGRNWNDWDVNALPLQIMSLSSTANHTCKSSGVVV